MKNTVGADYIHQPFDFSGVFSVLVNNFQNFLNYRLVLLNFSCHFPGRLPLVIAASAGLEGFPEMIPNVILPFDG